jgi:hypothetical protein
MGGQHVPPIMQQRTTHSYPELNSGSGAKWVKNLTQNRLSTFSGGHFSDVNLSSVLFTHRLDSSEFVKLQVWSPPGLTKPSFEEAIKQKYKPAKKGDSFGPSCESKSAIHLGTGLKSVFVTRGMTIYLGLFANPDAIQVDQSLVESTRDNPWLLGPVRACPMYIDSLIVT